MCGWRSSGGGAVGLGDIQSALPCDEGFVSGHDLSRPKRQNLVEGLDRALHASSSRHVVVIEPSHTDLRTLSFLSDRETLKMLSHHGVTKAFIELPPPYQHKIDAAAAGLRESIIDISASLMGPAAAQERDLFTVRLSRNARAEGIKTFASDINNQHAVRLLFGNSCAMDVQANALHAVGLKQLGQSWSRAGQSCFMRVRLDDRKTAAFIRDQTASGERSLVICGGAHGHFNGPKALRNSLSDAVALSFYEPSRDMTWVRYGALRSARSSIGSTFRLNILTLSPICSRERFTAALIS